MNYTHALDKERKFAVYLLPTVRQKKMHAEELSFVTDLRNINKCEQRIIEVPGRKKSKQDWKP